jgi:hypothetical protein
MYKRQSIKILHGCSGGKMIMDQANSSTHLVLKDKLTICIGDVLKIASHIPFILLSNNFFMSKMTYLLFPNPPTPPINMKVWIVKIGRPFK